MCARAQSSPMRENPVHQVCEENVWTGGAKRCVLCANHRGDCKLVFVRENNTQKISAQLQLVSTHWCVNLRCGCIFINTTPCA